VHAVVVDICDAPAVTAALRPLTHITGLCNAAGGSGRRFGDGPVGECTLEGWQTTLDLNLTSQFVMCKACLPALLANRGAIVNVASVLGIVGGDADFATHAYAASKSRDYRAESRHGQLLCATRATGQCGGHRG